ncbi:hypothetical protein KP509_03G023800 [Ceratopteris richardii]|uniref:Glutaredoxin domain-containing protein n=1 Tax=Ceratopteris richardii TaxID=49495 RepID=A0A8T2V4S9_CERRI|nr:hypothetical protein KP509_03G023800 [Ceratopteris richardii]
MDTMSRSEAQELLWADHRCFRIDKPCVPSALQLLSPLDGPLERVEKIAMENAVVVFGMSTCCMCHVAKTLLCGMGVNPRIVELDNDVSGPAMERAIIAKMVLLPYSNSDIHQHPPLSSAIKPTLPAIFMGGRLIGGLDHLMALHISGSLIPLLKDVGALWL